MDKPDQPGWYLFRCREEPEALFSGYWSGKYLYVGCNRPIGDASVPVSRFNRFIPLVERATSPLDAGMLAEDLDDLGYNSGEPRLSAGGMADALFERGWMAGVRTVTVLCANDYPEKVYLDEATAERDKDQLNVDERREHAGQRVLNRRQLIYYHTHVVPLVVSRSLPAACECARCGSARDENGRCQDKTCPFSDHEPQCPVGWVGHPSRQAESDPVCICEPVKEQNIERAV